MARVRIHPPIVVDDYVVREYTMDDLEALDAAIVRNREHLLPWVGDWIKAEPIGLAKRSELLRQWVDSYAEGADNPVGIFAGDMLVGGTGLHDRNEPHDVEVGYWVDREFEGRGIATRVTAALIERAFATPDVDRVLLLHNIDNAKSRRVPEKLGLREVPGEHRCGEAPGAKWEFTRAMWEQAMVGQRSDQG